ncbi:MAG: ribulose-phosphate 3-epimerase [Synergistales bacterium]|nr:ribulose-phosphate 3-epimerase [Synergistales bacterium]
MARSLSLDRGRPLLAPSLLAADPLAMARSIDGLSGEADCLHVDVMDGRYVPNISYGPSLVRALRKRYPEEILDVHLMVEEPERHVDDFAEAGADYLTVHVEATIHLHRLLTCIRDLGCHPGVTLNPGTPIESVRPILHLVDLVLVMSVNPGFGGQSFLPEVLSKTRTLCQWRAADGLSFLVEMDGGLGLKNVAEAVSNGCDVLVAGSSVFGAADPLAALRQLRAAALGGVLHGRA